MAPPPLRPSLLKPKHPERVCWGCKRYCPADSMSCGNGSDRTPHPVEVLGEDWLELEGASSAPAEDTSIATP
jgi:hypothetical protein